MWLGWTWSKNPCTSKRRRKAERLADIIAQAV
jgi:hypothetical protein